MFTNTDLLGAPDLLRNGRLRGHGGGDLFFGRRAELVDPYFVWASPQDIRVLRLWGAGGDVGTFVRVYVDLLTAGADPTLESSWTTTVFDSDGVLAMPGHPQIVEIDLGQAYTTTGLRIRAEMTNSADTRRTISEVQIFGDLGGDPGQGSFLDFRVEEIVNSWTASSSGYGAGIGNIPYARNGDRWLTLDQNANNEATGGGDAYWLACTFDGTDGAAFNTVEVCWLNKNDHLWRETPSYWIVQYATVDDPGTWQTAGTYEKTSNGFGEDSLMYLCDLGDLTGVKAMRIVVPYDALSSEAFAIGANQVAFYNIPAVPEPMTISLLALGGLAMLRRRRQVG